MKIFDGGCIFIVVLLLGIVKGVFNVVCQYVKEREQFGKLIFKFQVIVFKLVDMVIEIEVFELLICKAGELKDVNEFVIKVFVMVKYFVFEMVVKVVNEGV